MPLSSGISGWNLKKLDRSNVVTLGILRQEIMPFKNRRDAEAAVTGEQTITRAASRRALAQPSG